MALRLKVSAGGPPPGTYTARWLGYEAATHEEYGAGLKWTWEITSGPCAGQRATRTTGVNPTPRNSAGKLLAGILGRQLLPDEDVNLDPYIGRVYLIVVGAGQQGGTRVETCIPAPAA